MSTTIRNNWDAGHLITFVFVPLILSRHLLCLGYVNQNQGPNLRYFGQPARIVAIKQGQFIGAKYPPQQLAPPEKKVFKRPNPGPVGPVGNFQVYQRVFPNYEGRSEYNDGNWIPINQEENVPKSFVHPILYRSRNIPVVETLVITKAVDPAFAFSNYIPFSKASNPRKSEKTPFSRPPPVAYLEPYSFASRNQQQQANQGQGRMMMPQSAPPQPQWSGRQVSPMHSSGGGMILNEARPRPLYIPPQPLSRTRLPPFRTIRKAPPGSFFIPVRALDGTMTYTVDRPQIPIRNNNNFPWLGQINPQLRNFQPQARNFREKNATKFWSDSENNQNYFRYPSYPIPMSFVDTNEVIYLGQRSRTKKGQFYPVNDPPQRQGVAAVVRNKTKYPSHPSPFPSNNFTQDNQFAHPFTLFSQGNRSQRQVRGFDQQQWAMQSRQNFNTPQQFQYSRNPYAESGFPFHTPTPKPFPNGLGPQAYPTDVRQGFNQIPPQGQQGQGRIPHFVQGPINPNFNPTDTIRPPSRYTPFGGPAGPYINATTRPYGPGQYAVDRVWPGFQPGAIGVQTNTGPNQFRPDPQSFEAWRRFQLQQIGFQNFPEQNKIQQKEPTNYSQEGKSSLLYGSGGEMQFYSQTQPQPNYGRLPGYNETKEYRRFEGDSAILQRHLQRAKQVLLEQKSREESLKHVPTTRPTSTSTQPLKQNVLDSAKSSSGSRPFPSSSHVPKSKQSLPVSSESISSIIPHPAAAGANGVHGHESLQPSRDASPTPAHAVAGSIPLDGGRGQGERPPSESSADVRLSPAEQHDRIRRHSEGLSTDEILLIEETLGYLEEIEMESIGS